MAAVQRALLVMFAVFAVLTVFQQVRYGMICGRAEGEDKQADPGVFYAIAAGICLVVNIVLGAIGKMA